jgi:hypothetical protein
MAKDIKLTDIGQIKNELAKYRKGRKLDIRLFNQVARLAWLGRITLCPLDPDDPACEAWLLHLQPLEGLAAEMVQVDEDLNGMPFAAQIHILDTEQGAALAAIFRQGMEQRALELRALAERDFYFERFFHADKQPQS